MKTNSNKKTFIPLIIVIVLLTSLIFLTPNKSVPKNSEQVSTPETKKIEKVEEPADAGTKSIDLEKPPFLLN